MRIIKSTWILWLFFSMQAFSQNTLKIQGGATIHLSGGALVTLQNFDLDNDGTLNPAANAGRIVFKGTATNVIKGNGVTNFDELEIAKTGSLLTLQTNSDIRSGIWFTSGLLRLEGSVITLLGNAALNGESETSRLTTTNDGYAQVSMQLNAPNNQNPGNLGAIISSGQNLGLTVIRRGHEELTVEAGRKSILRYFIISPATNTGLDATLRMEYANAELNSQSEDAIQFRISDGAGGWIKRTATSRNTTANYAELTGINSFTQITLADDGAGLPVLFKLFTVACGNNETELTWITASEQNSKYFEVQRSGNGTSWTTIANLPAAGNSNSDKRYSYTDVNPQGKYYRIREVDLDGRDQYTQVGVADCAGDINFKAWPNPVQDILFVTIKADRAATAAIQVYNSEGKLVKKQNSGLLAGSNQLTVDMHSLPTGYYHIEMINNDGLRKTLMVFKK